MRERCVSTEGTLDATWWKDPKAMDPRGQRRYLEDGHTDLMLDVVRWG